MHLFSMLSDGSRVRTRSTAKTSQSHLATSHFTEFVRCRPLRQCRSNRLPTNDLRTTALIKVCQTSSSENGWLPLMTLLHVSDPAASPRRCSAKQPGPAPASGHRNPKAHAPACRPAESPRPPQPKPPPSSSPARTRRPTEGQPTRDAMVACPCSLYQLLWVSM